MPDTLTVLMPTGAQQTGAITTAPRPESLLGLRVALLDNGKEFSDIVLDGLAQALAREFAVASIKFWRKGFPAKGALFIAEMAAESDVAIWASDIAAHLRRGVSLTPSTWKRLACLLSH